MAGVAEIGMQALLLAALGGALVGLLLTLFGGGGSVLATPWLIYVVGIARYACRDRHLGSGGGGQCAGRAVRTGARRTG
jgi:hypothetical protein